MKQILQNLHTGKTELRECPYPAFKPEHLIIRTRASLLSVGTERMLLEFSKGNLFDKARHQPDKVRDVLNKIKVDGVISTINAVRSKLDQPLPLGYCNAGIIEGIDSGFQNKDFQKGDRVASNGQHAEMVRVYPNLCAKVPEEVSDEEAAFTVVGAIGLQGIRLAQPSLGEYFAVIGLGLIGLMTVQILKANGCHVIGIDPNPARCDTAAKFGIETIHFSQGQDVVSCALSFSKGKGVDGVLITAATKSNEPICQAARMCRKRGRIILVGVTGLELRRTDFYEKELSFQVSCSYGPGRYDPEYEQKGYDYPLGYVRWTARRNFQAVLDLMAKGKLDLKPLISHRIPFKDALKAYELIIQDKKSSLGIILTYGVSENDHNEKKRIIKLKDAPSSARPHSLGTATIGLIGAGNFTVQTLLPALKKTGVRLKTIAGDGGINCTHLGKKYGFELCTTNVENIFEDPEITGVFITTRHDTHSPFVLKTLRAGKHVFVEKPLCLSLSELEDLTHLYSTLPKTCQVSPMLMVGFNRRFAPHILRMKAFLDTLKEPKSFIMTINAGFIPKDHWTQDPKLGGGRIIGECCHFVDLLKFLAGEKIEKSKMIKMKSTTDDTASINLFFSDGSIGVIHYLSNGSKRYQKERLEVFCAGKILQLDNFKLLRGYGWKNFKKMRLWSQDKGHKAEVAAFIKAMKAGSPSPIPCGEIIEVMRTTIELATNQQ